MENLDEEHTNYNNVFANNTTLSIADIQKKLILSRLEVAYGVFEDHTCANENTSIKIKSEKRLDVQLKILLIILKPRLKRIGKYNSFEELLQKKDYEKLLEMIADYLDTDLKLTSIEQQTEIGFDEALE